jgi:toxin ParE1/3/4
MAAPTRRVHFGAAAELDFANIVKWTAENFGARQSRIYRDTLILAIRELGEGPDVIDSKARNESCPVFARCTSRGGVVVEVTS